MTATHCRKCHHTTRIGLSGQLFHSVPASIANRRQRVLMQECWCGCTSPQG